MGGSFRRYLEYEYKVREGTRVLSEGNFFMSIVNEDSGEDRFRVNGCIR